MRSRPLAGVTAAFLTLTGCAATGPAEPPAEPRVSVALVQNRSDQPVGRLQLRVTNESADELRIRRATLESAALAAPAVWAKGITLPGGATRDLAVVFPGASCASTAPDTVVRIEADTPDGPVTVEVAPTDPNDRMPLLTGTDCFAKEVAAVGRVSLPALHAGDPADPAMLEVRVESAGADRTLRITSLESTVLFSALDAAGRRTTSGSLGLELRPGQAEATALVPLVPNRCDPHALAEDKVGTLFALTAEVEGGSSGTLSLPASNELRAELYDYFSRACGL